MQGINNDAVIGCGQSCWCNDCIMHQVCSVMITRGEVYIRRQFRVFFFGIAIKKIYHHSNQFIKFQHIQCQKTLQSPRSERLSTTTVSQPRTSSRAITSRKTARTARRTKTMETFPGLATRRRYPVRAKAKETKMVNLLQSTSMNIKTFRSSLQH